MPLSVRRRADPDRRAAVLVDVDRAQLRPAAGDLDVDGHTDADLHRVRATAAGRLLRAQLLVAGEVEGSRERQPVVAGVVRGTHGRRDRLGERWAQVQPPQLDGVHAELVRRDVHHPLEELGRLGAARTPERAHRRRVGDDRRGVVADHRDAVDALGHHAGGP